VTPARLPVPSAVHSGEEPLTPAGLGIAAEAISSLPVEHAHRLAAFLDIDEPLRHGDALPMLWHWAFFTPTTRSSDIGSDGHARLPAAGPTAGLPRRMWAGGQVAASGPLRVGIDAARRTKVVTAVRKAGRSGPLLVVTLAHEIEQDGRAVVTERQDLIFRPGGTAVPTPVPGEMPGAPDGGWAQDCLLDPVQLFRFSALTFNSHRIHFDREYAATGEGYPGLVVHGPLTALLLVGACQRNGGPIRSFSFRASAPHFAGAAFRLLGTRSGEKAELRAIRCDGAVAMEATAEYA
jgi:3-methylfumaryl-CoA hydratase